MDPGGEEEMDAYELEKEVEAKDIEATNQTLNGK